MLEIIMKFSRYWKETYSLQIPFLLETKQYSLEVCEDFVQFDW